MKKDIADIKDIELLVNTFYKKVLNDDSLSSFFKHVNWEQHLPIMYQFWENALFFTGNYSGNPMKSHQTIHEQHPINESNFDQWLLHFTNTVDELFEGDKASLAKQRALSIATVLRIKLIK